MLSIDKNQIMIDHFDHVAYVSKDRISVEMKNMMITICGESLHVAALGKDELLIEGVFQELNFLHET